MARDNVPDEDIEQAAEQINDFLSRGLEVREVTPVDADEVESRTAGHGATEHLGEYSVYYRVEVRPVKKQDVIETRGELESHIRDQFESMEQNSNAPDTLLFSTDHPPQHLENKNLVFYVESVL